MAGEGRVTAVLWSFTDPPSPGAGRAYRRASAATQRNGLRIFAIREEFPIHAWNSDKKRRDQSDIETL